MDAPQAAVGGEHGHQRGVVFRFVGILLGGLGRLGGRQIPDVESGLLGVQHPGKEFRPIGAEGQVRGPAAQLGDHLALSQPFGLRPALELQGGVGELGAEALVAVPGPEAEGGPERGLEVALARQAHPEGLERLRIPGLRLQPLEVGAAAQVGHAAAQEAVHAAEGLVGGQLALQGPLAQHRGADGAVGPAAARQLPFDEGGVALDDPAG